MRNISSLLLLALFLSTVSSSLFASPCDEINQHLDQEYAKSLEPKILKQIQKIETDARITELKILQLYEKNGWRIVYIEPLETERLFLFYSGDPTINDFITIWSGIALQDEEHVIKKWVIENAKGVPDNLASCFAWHVTKNRDM